MGDVLIRCSVCTSLLDEEDLFCANCGTECPPRERPNAAQDRATRTSRDNFECSGCGASMSYDASAKSLRCPFCGSLDMVARPDIAVLNPSTVVPFRFEQSEALARLREWLGKGFWRPGALARQAAVVKITAVYVPYWVFQAQTHTFWTADTNQTPPGARGDWYPLSGEHHGSYAGVLVGASSALTAQETAALQPFDLDSGVPAAQVDLDNVVVEQLALPRKYARPLAQQGLEDRETHACCSRYVPGCARNVHVNLRITDMASQAVLLPVWIMAYRFRDHLYRFLINGQSGQASGEAPVSFWKIAAAVMIVLVILAILLLASGALGAECQSMLSDRGAVYRFGSPWASTAPPGSAILSGILNVRTPMV